MFSLIFNNLYQHHRHQLDCTNTCNNYTTHNKTNNNRFPLKCVICYSVHNGNKWRSLLWRKLCDPNDLFNTIVNDYVRWHRIHAVIECFLSFIISKKPDPFNTFIASEMFWLYPNMLIALCFYFADTNSIHLHILSLCHRTIQFYFLQGEYFEFLLLRLFLLGVDIHRWWDCKCKSTSFFSIKLTKA